MSGADRGVVATLAVVAYALGLLLGFVGAGGGAADERVPEVPRVAVVAIPFIAGAMLLFL